MKDSFVDREKLSQLLEGAEERTVGYVRKWLQNKGFRAAVHGLDGEEEPRPADVDLKRAG